MKRLFLIVAAVAFALTACNHKGKNDQQTTSNEVTTTIKGSFVGSGVSSISLERISDDFTKTEPVASCELTANGEFSFALQVEEGASPRYYFIVIDGERFSLPLIVAPGDNIVLESAGDIFHNYRVSGSEESQLLRDFNAEYCESYQEFVDCLHRGDNRAATEVAIAAIRKQIEFIGRYGDKLAAIYATRLSLFEAEISALIPYGVNYMHLDNVREALMKSYPESPYIAMLSREVELSRAIDEAPVALYHDIALTDINNNVHKLSDLKGKVTLLCFWSSQDSMSNIFVAQFKEIYERYHDAGLEAYFVAADRDRLAWIKMVQMQGHPWASVYGGDNPRVFANYNIQVVPYAFIIDKSGNLSYAPLNAEELEKLIKELL